MSSILDSSWNTDLEHSTTIDSEQSIFHSDVTQHWKHTESSKPYTLKQSSKWPLFNFTFSDLALMVLKWNFAWICAFQWTKVKRCFGRVFYHFTIVGLKNAKKFFGDNKGFERSFVFQIEVKVISNPSSWLVKTPHPWIFDNEWFLWFFLNSSFSNIFKNNHLLILKPLYVFYFMKIC